MKRRLARHGFTRSFQLHADPEQQDQLTTWYEYLCCEYWWLDRHASEAERLKPDHDKRGQELLDLKFIMPHETPESVQDMFWALGIDKEGNEAVKSRRRSRQRAKESIS